MSILDFSFAIHQPTLYNIGDFKKIIGKLIDWRIGQNKPLISYYCYTKRKWDTDPVHIY